MTIIERITCDRATFILAMSLLGCLVAFGSFYEPVGNKRSATQQLTANGT